MNLKKSMRKSNTFTLTTPHTFENTESVRVFSDNGRLPDGVDPNTVYFVITDSNTAAGITTNVDIQLAKTKTDAENASEGNLKLIWKNE